MCPKYGHSEGPGEDQSDAKKLSDFQEATTVWRQIWHKVSGDLYSDSHSYFYSVIGAAYDSDILCLMKVKS